METISWSGLLVCWIPLIVTILGFIVAGFFTDVHARRAYLRFPPSDEKPTAKLDGSDLKATTPVPND